MPFAIPKPIEQNYENGASAVIIDIRGSSELVREKSYSDSIENYNKALKEHTGFMMNLFKTVFDYISLLQVGDNYSFNDTGDGCLCVFWDEHHPLTCIKIASAIYLHLLSDKYAKKNDIGFGIGLHTGGCLIYRSSVPKRDFVFGIVANTAARVETFTKNLKIAVKKWEDVPRLVFTGNFKDCLEELLNDEDKKRIVRISDYRIFLNDGKDNGHVLYTLATEDIKYFGKR